MMSGLCASIAAHRSARMTGRLAPPAAVGPHASRDAPDSSTPSYHFGHGTRPMMSRYRQDGKSFLSSQCRRTAAPYSRGSVVVPSPTVPASFPSPRRRRVLRHILSWNAPDTPQADTPNTDELPAALLDETAARLHPVRGTMSDALFATLVVSVVRFKIRWPCGRTGPTGAQRTSSGRRTTRSA
jgi:hypothetical protein